MPTFGRKIAAARHEAKLTQQELGNTVGVTDAAVRQWESDRAKPSLDRLTQIAQATDKPISYFLDGAQGQSAAEIAGLTLTGPEPLLARVIQAALTANAALLGNTANDDPQGTHQGLQQLLAMHENGQLERQLGITLTLSEQAWARTFGPGGPPIDTLQKALAQLQLWRQWELEDRWEALKPLQPAARPAGA